MDTITKLACLAAFVPAMWGVHYLMKAIVADYGLVWGAIASVALFATACLMGRRS
jgi:hypothetical protein